MQTNLLHNDNDPPLMVESTPDFQSRIEDIMAHKYSHHHFSQSDLCTLLNISRTHLHNLIKHHYNMSTTAFINDFRLKKGIKLLMNENFAISTIAHMIGYKDTKYFSRLFSKRFKMSPIEFKHRNKDPDAT